MGTDSLPPGVPSSIGSCSRASIKRKVRKEIRNVDEGIKKEGRKLVRREAPLRWEVLRT